MSSSAKHAVDSASGSEVPKVPKGRAAFQNQFYRVHRSIFALFPSMSGGISVFDWPYSVSHFSQNLFFFIRTFFTSYCF